MLNETIRQELNVTMDKSFQETVDVLIVVLSCIGIVGNAFSLVVLCRRNKEPPMKQFALTILVGLSVSDLLFSLCMLPSYFVKPRQISYSVTFALVYEAYLFPVVNTFILSSTLLTLILALGRYLVVTCTFKVRSAIHSTLARCLVPTTFAIALLANLPRFWLYKINCVRIEDIYTDNDTRLAYNETTDFANNTVSGENETFSVSNETVDMKSASIIAYNVTTNDSVRRALIMYFIFYFALFIFLPFMTLLYCNIRLINELRVPVALRDQVNQQLRMKRKDFRRLTVCLLLVVACFLLLVLPGEVIVFCIELTHYYHPDKVDGKFSHLQNILCVMQSLNFAVNYMFYCYIMKNWRKAVAFVLCCGCANRQHNHDSLLSRSGMTISSRMTTLRSERQLTTQVSQESSRERRSNPVQETRC